MIPSMRQHSALRTGAGLASTAGAQPRPTSLMHVSSGNRNRGDAELAAYLEAAWQVLRSEAAIAPACPHCGADDAHACAPSGDELPQFRCRHCRRRFTRLSATPLARLRHVDRFAQIFPLLARSMSLAEAARQLEVKAETVAHWSTQIRQWLLMLDPSGQWERRVQLGVHYAVVPAGTPRRLEPRPAGCRCMLAGAGGEARPLPQDGELGLEGPLLLRVCPQCDSAR